MELSSFCSSSSVVVMTMVWWDIEECSSSNLCFIGAFLCSFKTHSGFPLRGEFGLIQCANACPSACIWMLGKIS
jgi:hypothetical protein